ncbi:MAG TPA: hypothetical protein VD836_04535 [Solirubrobacteraceae bacterium]|nr:hypothetical protein [Solirubrobacteraceae bacterium]
MRDVAFELEAFEWSEDRLDVVGRWQGLAGRRLARPVLTVQLDSGRRKRVVAMPGGQLGASGESWQASFNWPGDPADIIGVELELGRNVVVELPLPDRRRRRRRSRQQPADQSVTEELRLEAGALRAQVDRLRAELAGRERELMAAREQLSEIPVPDQPTMALREVEPAAAEPAPDAADHEAELARLREEHEAERAHLQEELDVLRESFAAAAEEAEQTRKRHQAELAALRAEAAEQERFRRPGRRGAAAPASDPDVAEPAGESDTPPAAVEPSAAVEPPGAAKVEPPLAVEPPGADEAPDSGEAPGPGEAPADLPATAAHDVDEPDPEPTARATAVPPATAAGAAAPAAFAARSNGAAHHDDEAGAEPDGRSPLEQLRERIADLFAGLRPGDSPPVRHDEDEQPPVLRATRSASAARARAGSAVAARRSPAELWLIRALAAVVVLVLLITFLLLITSIA